MLHNFQQNNCTLYGEHTTRSTYFHTMWLTTHFPRENTINTSENVIAGEGETFVDHFLNLYRNSLLNYYSCKKLIKMFTNLVVFGSLSDESFVFMFLYLVINIRLYLIEL